MTEIEKRPSRLPWPPIIYISALALAVILAYFLPNPWITEPISDLLFAAGIILIVAAVFMIVLALRALRLGGTTVRPHRAADHLVTNGPFGISRNPLYLSNTLVMVGIGLVAGSLWFILIGLIAAFATQKLAIEPEEAHLEARFGKRYRDYRRSVRRWI